MKGGFGAQSDKFNGAAMIEDGLDNNPGVSREALAALHEGAFGWALSLTGGRTNAAEDVMQQAYLSIVDGTARFDGHASLKTWLYAVIRNAARHQLRRERLERLWIARFGTPDAAAEPEEPTRGGDDSVAVRVRRAIRQLPRRQRDLLELVIDAEFTIEQAASVLGISLGTARTHYHRAKQSVRRRLEENDE